MRVKFVRTFFGPDAKRYRPLEVYDVPDDWEAKGVLPKGTIVLPDDAGSIEANKDSLLNEKIMAARNASALAAKAPARVAVSSATKPNRAAGEYAIGDSDEEMDQTAKLSRKHKGETDDEIRSQAALLTGKDKDEIDVEALKASPEKSTAKPTEDAKDPKEAEKAKEAAEKKSDAPTKDEKNETKSRL